MKLHIGCGKKYIPGYKHLDVINFDHVDFVCDTRKLTIIEDNSVSEIYACHILEHVERNEVVSVLREWNRVLKVGGVLRVAVPDFEAVVAEYQERKICSVFRGFSMVDKRMTITIIMSRLIIKYWSVSCLRLVFRMSVVMIGVISYQKIMMITVGLTFLI